jgi:hypothetical protein
MQTFSTVPLTILGLIAIALLAGFFIYAAMAGRRKVSATALLPGARDDLSHAEALSAKNASERPTEDDMQAAELGPRGIPGEPSPAKMTPQRAKKTPAHLEPGHTA